jgi:glycosyltransferase involved in cell wall biosynthesis
MASSLPIITTPVGGIPSILKHNETAIFVEPGNVSALAEAINCLLADDVRCTSLAARAFDLVSKKYDLAAASAGLARIYDRYRPLPCEKF